MTESSDDLYTSILDLPPGPRPPHYYDLLELELFCSHPERIHQAILKQFRTIKPYHNHPDRQTREAIQDMMNEIATARVVLTNPRYKDAYDQALAAELKIDRDAYIREKVAAPVPEFGIRVIAGPSLVGRHVELVEGVAHTFGSDRHGPLPLASGRAAPRHCVIEQVDGDWVVRAIDPQRPIHVNDNPCAEFVLADGDRIDLGGYRLRFARIIRDPAAKPATTHQPPPLSLIVQKGPSITAPVFNALPPQRFLIGHAETALWQLPDPLVSRHHCAVQSVADRWEIEDLGNTNGTGVNGVEVLRDLLSDRDIITIGRFEILVSLRF